MSGSVNIDPQTLWERILSVVKEQVNSQSFQTWIRPTALLRFDANALYVESPNQFFTDWLSEHHMAALRAAAKEVLGFAPEIVLVNAEDGDGANGGKREHRPQFSIFHRETRPAKRGGLGLNAGYTFREFVVGPSNRMAHAASLAVAEKPGKIYNPLFIYGGVGLGKTHLAQAIAHFVLEEHRRSRVFYTTSETFVNELIQSIRQGKTLEFKDKYRSVDLLIIDDVQFLAGKESTQEEFFHTFNSLYDASKQIVVTSDRPPKEIKSLEERLISRFEWGLITDIQIPDLETRLAILKKKTEKDGMDIPDEVLYLIAENVRNSIRELEGSLIRLLAYANLTRRSEITVGLAQEVLRDFIKERPHVPNIVEIQKVVAEAYGISVEQMRSEKRNSSIVLPRQVAIYLCRTLTDKSLVEIGAQFGGRDHTTVLHAFQKIDKQMKADPELRRRITELDQRFQLPA